MSFPLGPRSTRTPGIEPASSRRAATGARRERATPRAWHARADPRPPGRTRVGRVGALSGLVDRGLMAPDWAEALAPVDERITAMGRFLRGELGAGHAYLPAGDDVFKAFRRPLADVRVLVVGQDPYPTQGHPIGLSFAVAPDVRPLPGSLRNIYQELSTDLGIPPAPHGDLTAWADRGVMLLNRVLTVRPGEAAS